jgi:hypothetical protein
MNNSKLRRTANTRILEFITTLPIKLKQRGKMRRGKCWWCAARVCIVASPWWEHAEWKPSLSFNASLIQILWGLFCFSSLGAGSLKTNAAWSLTGRPTVALPHHPLAVMHFRQTADWCGQIVCEPEGLFRPLSNGESSKPNHVSVEPLIGALPSHRDQAIEEPT